jgi:predicted dehydrogenase
MKQIKIAVVGGGNWGINHIRTLFKMNSLSGIVESNLEKASQLSKDFPNIPIVQKLDALPKDTRGIVVATPVPTHFEIAKEAINLNLSVLVEKPTTPSLVQTQDLINVAESKKLSFMTGFILLYSPAIQKIKHLLIENSIGKIKTFTFTRVNTGKARSFENAWWSLGVHDVAVLSYLHPHFPATVSTNGQKQSLSKNNTFDETRITIKFENNVQSHFLCSWNWPFKRRELLITGEKGYLFFDESKAQLTLHKKYIDESLNIKDEGASVYNFEDADLLKLELTDFIDSIQNKKQALAGNEPSLKVAEIFEKAGF